MLEETTIKIKGKEFVIKPSVRTYIQWERKEKRTVDTIETTEDLTKFLFYSLQANNRKHPNKFTLGYEAFLDELDENPEFLNSVGALQEESEETEGEKK